MGTKGFLSRTIAMSFVLMLLGLFALPSNIGATGPVGSTTVKCANPPEQTRLLTMIHAESRAGFTDDIIVEIMYFETHNDGSISEEPAHTQYVKIHLGAGQKRDAETFYGSPRCVGRVRVKVSGRGRGDISIHVTRKFKTVPYPDYQTMSQCNTKVVIGSTTASTEYLNCSTKSY